MEPQLVTYTFHATQLGTVQAFRLVPCKVRKVHHADVHDAVKDVCHNYTLCGMYMMMLQMHVTMILRPTLLPHPHPQLMRVMYMML